MAEALSLRTVLTFLGSRCSEGVSNRNVSPQLLIVFAISVYQGKLAKPVVFFSFSRWNKVTEILLGFPVDSLDQKLTILCLMVHTILDRPGSPRAMLFEVLGLRCSMYLQN